MSVVQGSFNHPFLIKLRKSFMNIGACSLAAGLMKGCAGVYLVENPTYGLYSAPATIYPPWTVQSIRIAIERVMNPVSTGAKRIAFCWACDVFRLTTRATLSSLNRLRIARTISSPPSITIFAITHHSLQAPSCVCISYGGLIYTSCHQLRYDQTHRLS